MAHTLILGITETGKTTLARQLAAHYKTKGKNVLVLDPFKSERWAADYITDNPELFMKAVFSNTKCGVFIDEAGDMLNRYDEQLSKLATMSRHGGHNAHFICQRAQMIAPTVRNQCTNIFLFKQSRKDSEILAREFVADELLQAVKLKKGQFLAKIGVDGVVKRGKIF